MHLCYVYSISNLSIPKNALRFGTEPSSVGPKPSRRSDDFFIESNDQHLLLVRHKFNSE